MCGTGTSLIQYFSQVRLSLFYGATLKIASTAKGLKIETSRRCQVLCHGLNLIQKAWIWKTKSNGAGRLCQDSVDIHRSLSSSTRILRRVSDIFFLYKLKQRSWMVIDKFTISYTIKWEKIHYQSHVPISELQCFLLTGPTSRCSAWSMVCPAWNTGTTGGGLDKGVEWRMVKVL